MSTHTRPVCPACSDTLLITYDGLSVDCPLHDGPLEPIPADVAQRISEGVNRELGITPRVTITARGWAVGAVLSLGLWALILTGSVLLVRAILRWLS